MIFRVNEYMSVATPHAPKALIFHQKETWNTTTQTKYGCQILSFFIKNETGHIPTFASVPFVFMSFII
jgi:hypothetical protein